MDHLEREEVRPREMSPRQWEFWQWDRVTKLESALGLIGRVFVGFAMGAQAFFGVLLLNIYYRKNFSTQGQLAACMATLPFVFFSKYFLVAQHSANDFKKMAHASWWYSWDPRHYTYNDWVFSAFNAVIAFGGIQAFVGITGISLDGKTGAANLLRSYDSTGADAAADVIGSLAFQKSVMWMALAVNLFFFPNMNKLAWSNLKRAFGPYFERRKYKALKAEINIAAQRYRCELRRLCAAGNGINADNTALNENLTTLQRCLNVIERVEKGCATFDDKSEIEKFIGGTLTLVSPAASSSLPLALENPDIQMGAPLSSSPVSSSASPASGGHSIQMESPLASPSISPLPPLVSKSSDAQKAVTVALIGIGGAGFLNLYGLAKLLAPKIAEIFLDGSESYASSEAMMKVSGWLAVIALISTCIAVVPPAVDKGFRSTRYSGERSYIAASSRSRPYVNVIAAMLICALGATPNTYQAVLNEQSSDSGGGLLSGLLIAFAALGSVLIEFDAAHEGVKQCRCPCVKLFDIAKNVKKIDEALIRIENNGGGIGNKIAQHHRPTEVRFKSGSQILTAFWRKSVAAVWSERAPLLAEDTGGVVVPRDDSGLGGSIRTVSVQA